MVTIVCNNNIAKTIKSDSCRVLELTKWVPLLLNTEIRWLKQSVTAISSLSFTVTPHGPLSIPTDLPFCSNNSTGLKRLVCTLASKGLSRSFAKLFPAITLLLSLPLGPDCCDLISLKTVLTLPMPSLLNTLISFSGLLKLNRGILIHSVELRLPRVPCSCRIVSNVSLKPRTSVLKLCFNRASVHAIAESIIPSWFSTSSFFCKRHSSDFCACSSTATKTCCFLSSIISTIWSALIAT